jgi:acyl carrier protein
VGLVGAGGGVRGDAAELVFAAIRELARQGVLPRELADRELSVDTLIDHLCIDSLGKLGLLTELEERANLMLNDWEIVGLRTLGDIADVLTRLSKQQSEP